MVVNIIRFKIIFTIADSPPAVEFSFCFKILYIRHLIRGTGGIERVNIRPLTHFTGSRYNRAHCIVIQRIGLQIIEDRVTLIYNSVVDINKVCINIRVENVVVHNYLPLCSVRSDSELHRVALDRYRLHFSRRDTVFLHQFQIIYSAETAVIRI